MARLGPECPQAERDRSGRKRHALVDTDGRGLVRSIQTTQRYIDGDTDAQRKPSHIEFFELGRVLKPRRIRAGLFF